VIRLRPTNLSGLLPVVALVALATAPLYLGTFRLSQLSLFACLAALAISLDLAWGQAGILSLGHAGFFGIGAYAMGIITTRPALGGSAVVALVVGVAAAGVFAIVLGWFAFGGRVAGPFLGILTLAVALLLEQVALQWKSVTGGFDGIFGIAPLAIDQHTAFYICAAGLVAVYLTARFVAGGSFGLALAALRDNESRAQFSGYNPVTYSTVVFAISGALAGLAGGLYAQQAGFVSPTLLGFTLSVQVAIWVVLGGRATLLGAAVGAIVVNSIHDSLPDSAIDDYELILGTVFILVVLLLPLGLYGTLHRLAARVRLGAPSRRRRVPVSDHPWPAPAATDEALVTSGVARGFGSLSVLKSVDLVVRTGELRSLIGPNGAGKTTLLNVMTGVIPPSAGDVSLLGQRTTGMPPHRLVARGVGRKFQSPSTFPSLTVEQNLVVATLGRGNRWPAMLIGLSKPRIDAVAFQVLDGAGMRDRLDVPAADLSHGEQQSLELAMVLAGRPQLLLLDEPTAGLTPQETQETAEMLRRLAREWNLTIVAIEHDMGFVRAFSDSVTVLHRGTVLADGTLEETQNNDEVRNAYLGATA
jgi:branched-chain amino acid transport system permease protein